MNIIEDRFSGNSSKCQTVLGLARHLRIWRQVSFLDSSSLPSGDVEILELFEKESNAKARDSFLPLF